MCIRDRIFSSHFFERYIERFLELNKDEKQYTSLDIIKLFYLLNNHIGCIKPELEDLARGFGEDGMILGEWISAVSYTHLDVYKRQVLRYVS